MRVRLNRAIRFGGISITAICIGMFSMAVSANDSDNDGVHDANDLCPATDLSGAVPTSGTLCADCLGDTQTIHGCNASEILECKPGPNRRQYEFGIGQKIQAQFESLKGWSAKCGCDNNDDSDGDGFPVCLDGCPADSLKSLVGACGCGVGETDSDGDGVPDCIDECPGDPVATEAGPYGCGMAATGEIIAGEDFLLEIEGASFRAPADALPPGFEIQIAEVDPNILDDLPNGTGEALLGPVYVVTFSDQVFPAAELLIALDIPITVVDGFSAALKIQGGMASEGHENSGWLRAIGDYDEASSRLLLKLYATAQSIYVTTIQRASNSASQASGEKTFIKSKFSAPRLASDSSPGDVSPGQPDWDELGWVILCDPAEFERLAESACDSMSQLFLDMMQDMGAKLYASDQLMTSLGLFKGDHNYTHRSGIERSEYPYIIYDPDNRSPTAPVSGDGSNPAYFVAWVDPDIYDDTLGVYYPSTRIISLEQFVGDDTVAHELMHSAQRWYIPNAWGRNWIIEALAAAVQPFAPSGSGDGYNYRRYDLWRNWKYTLDAEGGQRHYLTLEFWLSITGNLDWIRDFYLSLGVRGELTKDNQYTHVNESLLDPLVGLPKIRDIYTTLILERNGDVDYPNCEQHSATCSVDEDCAVEVQAAPLSASCIDTSITFGEDTEACPNVNSDITVELNAYPDPANKLIVDGVVYEANTPVPFDGESRIWVMNLSERATQFGTLRFFRYEECYVQQVSQNIVARVDTSIYGFNGHDTILDSSLNERLVKRYRSFENLAEQSTMETYRRISAVEVENTTTPVPPLAFDEWSASWNSLSEFQDNPSGPRYSATATATVNSETEGTTRFLTTDGSTSTSATSTHESSRRTGGHGVAGGTYVYETIGYPADLTLNWACDLSYVRVKVTDPAINTSTTLLTASQRDGSWQCGTMNWNIDADREVEVTVSSTFNVDWMATETDGYGGDVQAPGGAYSIDLRSIETP